MRVEIKGFDKAYNNMLATEKVKELNKNAYKRRVQEFVDEGIDKMIAEAMAQAERSCQVRF